METLYIYFTQQPYLNCIKLYQIEQNVNNLEHILTSIISLVMVLNLEECHGIQEQNVMNLASNQNTHNFQMRKNVSIQTST